MFCLLQLAAGPRTHVHKAAACVRAQQERRATRNPYSHPLRCCRRSTLYADLVAAMQHNEATRRSVAAPWLLSSIRACDAPDCAVLPAIDSAPCHKVSHRRSDAYHITQIARRHHSQLHDCTEGCLRCMCSWRHIRAWQAAEGQTTEVLPLNMSVELHAQLGDLPTVMWHWPRTRPTMAAWVLVPQPDLASFSVRERRSRQNIAMEPRRLCSYVQVMMRCVQLCS